MLVLTRKLRQEIVISGDIRLTVLEIRGSRVKLGVTAPAHVDVRREEVPAESPKVSWCEALTIDGCD